MQFSAVQWSAVQYKLNEGVSILRDISFHSQSFRLAESKAEVKVRPRGRSARMSPLIIIQWVVMRLLMNYSWAAHIYAISYNTICYLLCYSLIPIIQCHIYPPNIPSYPPICQSPNAYHTVSYLPYHGSPLILQSANPPIPIIQCHIYPPNAPSFPPIWQSANHYHIKSYIPYQHDQGYPPICQSDNQPITQNNYWLEIRLHRVTNYLCS